MRAPREREDPVYPLLKHELKRIDESFEEFKHERLARDHRLNTRWYQVLLSFTLSVLTAAGSVVWFASNADSRIKRNFEAVQVLQTSNERLMDISSRMARTEAIVTLTDARVGRIERTLEQRVQKDD